MNPNHLRIGTCHRPRGLQHHPEVRYSPGLRTQAAGIPPHLLQRLFKSDGELGVVAHDCNLSIWESEIGEELMPILGCIIRTYLKNKNQLENSSWDRVQTCPNLQLSIAFYGQGSNV